MTEITDQYVPDLNDNLSIIEFDKSSYLICIDDEQPAKLKINNISKMLLDQIDGQKNIGEITHSFNEQSGTNFSTEAIISIFNNSFRGYGVFKNDHSEKIKVKSNYLKLRFILFPEKVVQRLVQGVLFLFNKKVFSFLFISCFLYLAYVFCTQINLNTLYHSIDTSLATWFIGLNLLSIIMHEFGHAGACATYGAKSGDIGFGFYLFTPVFYADVSDAWRLKRGERLIVDLAGIYIQLIFCSVFATVYFVNGNLFFLYISFLIASTIIVNINPFLRYDGYWALSDSINVPNLRENSFRLMRQFFRWCVNKVNSWKPTGMNIFLVVYAILSLAVIVYFLTMMLVFKHDSLLYFPVNLYRFFERFFTDINSVTFTWVKASIISFLLPLIFYILIYRFIVKRFFKPLIAKK